MPQVFLLLSLFGVGIASGYLNVMAGGGSTLALPMLIFMGLDSALANGTNRVAIIIQNIAAVGSFRRHDVHAFRESFMLSLWTLPGAILGAFVAIRISDEWFERILGIVLIGVVISLFLTPHPSSTRERSTHQYRWLVYPSLLAIGFYGGFIQVGVGFIFMAALYHLLRMNLVTVNMHKVFIVLVYTLPALLVFIVSGNVSWMLGLVLGAGSALGGWWAAHTSVRGGERVIRLLLIVAIFLMAMKLFGIF